jgi:hypothetical protein
MNTLLILQHGLAYGAVLSALLSLLVIITMAWNREIWLHDYPKDVRAAYGPPRRRETKWQKAIASLLFFGALVAVVAASLVRLHGLLGGLPFGAIVLNLFVMLMLFNLVDLVILDWLVLMWLGRELMYLPGVDRNLAGYRDWQLPARGFLKGSVGIFIGSLVLGGIVWAALALVA